MAKKSARKDNKSTQISAFAKGSNPGETELVPITDTLKNNYMPYAMSVIVSRAIPEIDGFKPSQRKVLYTMYKMGLLKGEHRAKCADIVGQTMAFNPHGDQTIYETMVRLTRGNEALLHPWIDSKGNMGKVYSRDMQYAAYRYTEARLDESCEILFSGLDKEAVPFVDNYSGTQQEPLLLPAAIPSVLINANQGIAVGMASNICSFNLRECCEATMALLWDENAEIMEIMPAPDFSTGASVLYSKEEMKRIYETGRGSFKLKAQTMISKEYNRIEVTEIPYSTSVEAIIEDISKNIKNGKIKEIIDIRDETDLKGLRIAIDLRKNADAELVLKKLLNMTPLISSFSCNFNILINNRPQVLGVREILLAWISWRKVCLRLELTFDRKKLEEKLHLLRALEKVLLDIDHAIRIIRRTEKEADVVPHLMAAFSIDEIQAEYVAEIKLRHLNREYLLRRTQDIAFLEDQINDITVILENEDLLNKLIAEQLTNYAEKYGKPRKTKLESAAKAEEIKIEPQIDDYNLKLFFTKEGYLKKIPLTSLRSAGDIKVKEDDEIIQEIEIGNNSEILFFSNQGNVHKLLTYEIEDHKPSQFGEFTPNLVELDAGEKILFIHATTDFSGYLMLVFADGRATKVAVDAYETKNNRKKLVNGTYDGAELRALYPIQEKNGAGDILIMTNQARMILVDSDLIPFKKTRSSQGVRLMDIPEEFQVSEVQRVTQDNEPDYAYYRVRTLPASGRFIKDDLLKERQLEFSL